MEKDDLVLELDRNMDTVYDSLLVLNATMTAIVQALSPDAAAQVTRHLDVSLDHIGEGQNPPALLHRLTLNGWRNMAARSAGLEPRRAPT